MVSLNSKFLFPLLFVLTLGVSSVQAQDMTIRDVEQLDFASGLLQRGLYDMASQEYQKYIDTFKDGQHLPDAYFGLAECAFFQEHYQEAIEGYKKYLAVYPQHEKSTIASLRLGQLFLLTKEYDKAHLYFKNIRTNQVDETFLQTRYFFEGRTYFEENNDAEALNLLQKAIDVTSQKKYTAQAYIFMGDIALRQNQPDQATAYYLKAQETAENDELKGMALLKQGQVKFNSKDYATAAETFKQLANQYPQLPIAQDALIDSFTAYYNLGQFDSVIAAFEDYEKKLEGQTGLLEIYLITVDAYMKLEKYNEAIDGLDKILKMETLQDSDKEKVLMKKAEVLIKSKNFEQAVDLINVELKPIGLDKEQILFLEGEAYFGQGSFENALTAYQQIAAEVPETVFDDEALYAIAHTYKSMERPEEALQAFLKYFEVGKNEELRSQALYNGMLIEIQTNSLIEAIEHAESYLTTFPQDPSLEKVLYLLGSLYKQNEQYDKAVEIFNKYIETYPDSPRLQEVYFLLGYNLQLLNKNDEALAIYEKVPADDNNKDFYYSALKNSGLIYLEKDEVEAATIFEKIIREFDQNDLSINTYLWLAERHLKAQKYADVLNVLNKAPLESATEQEQEGIAYFKAEAYRLNNDFNKAIEQYDQVLAKNPKGVYAGLSKVGKGLCLKDLKKYDEAKTQLTFQHIGILSLEFHVDKLSRPLL